jgi:sensor domain CHASE-containing protein
MTKKAWLRAALKGRSAWLAAGGLLAIVLLGLLIASQRNWHRRAAVLERENMSLQLTQVAQQIADESHRLVERARELAESDAAVGLVQDSPDASANRLELADMVRRGVDAVSVLTASRALRFSVAVANGQLSEQPPDPVLTRLIEPLAASTQSPDTTNRPPRHYCTRRSGLNFGLGDRDAHALAGQTRAAGALGE